VSSEKHPILFIGSTHPPVLADLDKLFTVYNYRDASDKDALIAAAAPHVRAVYTNGTAWVPPLLDKLPKLEMIACMSTGYDEFDIAALKKRSVRMSHSVNMSAGDVADMGMALVLATARKIPQYERYVRSGEWRAKGRPAATRRVHGKKLGIVGLGAIGRELAKRAAGGFDMEVSYQGPNRKADVPYRHYDSVLAMARDVDFLVLACIGGPTTANIVDAGVLKALGPDGILVNVARGTCVDEPALFRALKDGTIAGAGLDCYIQEPAEPAQFEGFENVVLSPHVAAGTPDTRRASCDLAIRNLLAFFDGKPLITPIDEIPN